MHLTDRQNVLKKSLLSFVMLLIAMASPSAAEWPAKPPAPKPGSDRPAPNYSIKNGTSVSGTAVAVTGSIIDINGELFRQLFVHDLNESQVMCSPSSRWTYDPFRTVRESLERRPLSSEIKRYCEQQLEKSERGEWPTGAELSRDSRARAALCQITSTALMQRDDLASLIDGKTVTCRTTNEQKLKSYWDSGRLYTTFGKPYGLAMCDVDGEPLDQLMIQNGHAKFQFPTKIVKDIKVGPDVYGDTDPLKRLEKAKADRKKMHDDGRDGTITMACQRYSAFRVPSGTDLDLSEYFITSYP